MQTIVQTEKKGQIGITLIIKIIMTFIIRVWGARGRWFESSHPDTSESIDNLMIVDAFCFIIKTYIQAYIEDKSCLIQTKSLFCMNICNIYGIHQRISQSMDRENSPIDCLLEQAACIVRRSKIAAGTLEPTESYKRGQSEELKSFADSLDL